MSPPLATVRSVGLLVAVSLACLSGGHGTLCSKELDTLLAGQSALQQQLDSVTSDLGRLRRLVAKALSCPDDTWLKVGDSCFKIDTQVEATWSEAQQRCARLHDDAQLASVHPCSQQALRDIFQLSGRPKVWLGLRRNQGQPWAWTDNSPLDYTDWDAGQPNNDEDSVSCVYWKLDSGHWHDSAGVGCSDRDKHALCELNLAGLPSCQP